MNKNLLTGAGVVLAIVLGLVGAFKATSSVDVNELAKAMKQQSYGSIASPNVQSPYINVGGVSEWYGHTENLNQASTTLCALQSPAATSTLQWASLHMDIATSGAASTVVVAKATTPFATTTLIRQWAITAGLEVNEFASSTAVSIFSPNTYLVMSQNGGSIGSTFSESGVCQAKWIQIEY